LATAQSHDGFLGEMGLELPPQGDAFEEGAGLVDARQAVAERRVHVEVGVDEGRAQQLALGIQLGASLGGQGGLHGHDAALGHAHVLVGAAIGQRAVADDEVEQGGLLSGVLQAA